MFVVKRNGQHEPVQFDKITTRIRNLQQIVPILEKVDAVLIAQKVIAGVTNGISTTALDNLAAETAAYMSTLHPQYNDMAARIAISNHHKQTESDVRVLIHQFPPSLVSEQFRAIVCKYGDVFQAAMQYEYDFKLDYFGFKTLEYKYLLKHPQTKQTLERVQHLFLRVAIEIHKEDIAQVLQTLDDLRNFRYIHASPTLFNAGTPTPQLSSCFLLAMKDDSIVGIYDTLKDCAVISKGAGGIGLHVSNVRGSGAHIAGTNGHSNGIIPMLRVFNASARYVDQGGGKRPGAIAVYLEPWHPDIREFVQIRKNTGEENIRCRDLFCGLWIPDLFMKRVSENKQWSLIDPTVAPDLLDLFGDAFEQRYCEVESSGKIVAQFPAVDLWNLILDNQMEASGIYILYKDHVNRKSNQANLGTIRSSNLCTEIVQFSSPEETAVCNLASISLPSCIVDGQFDHACLHNTTQQVVRNLNRVIDATQYPTKEARVSNIKHRPIGIGVQGLANTFLLLGYPFESEDAFTLNREIFETMYHAALTASCQLAQQDGPYASFYNSPLHQGQFQFDLWDASDKGITQFSGRYDWDALRQTIQQYGIRNSLLLAPMPTAATSQMLRNNECFEPFTYNIYTRRVSVGTFLMVNPYLVEHLEKQGKWNASMSQRIMEANGSIQQFPDLDVQTKSLFKTAFEMKQRRLIDMAADRGRFIDQSQSFNIFCQQPSRALLNRIHQHTFEKGLKTGIYYLHTPPKADPIKFSMELNTPTDTTVAACRNRADCEACSS